jgi:hypothetical protein
MTACYSITRMGVEMPKPLTDEQIADLWDWDISSSWVRERLARRIRDAGYVVVRESTVQDHTDGSQT